ncbi:putative terpene synthase 13 [Sarracenia purpurea var. burkii]
MANFCSSPVSFHLPIPLNNTPQIGKTTTHNWRIAEDFKLNSSHLKHENHQKAHHNFSDEFYLRHKQKVNEVREVLQRKVGESPSEGGLVMVDTLQRLCIDYHFQEEIEGFLEKQFVKSTFTNCPEFDLYELSTWFRLLRQEGYNVHAEVFNSVMDKEGRFKPELSADLRGLMGLYEASQLSIGEDILDQAEDFSSLHLGRWITYFDHRQAKLVVDVLRHPYHKSLARFTARNLFVNYASPNGWVKRSQELAKIDNIILQSTQKEEILQVSQWWEDQGLASELRFIRNQPLKWYMWSMAILTDQSSSEQRIELTKAISFIYIIDDIFDVYGSLEELTLFTEAVNRWELAAVEKLPDYMRNCFKALYYNTNEIAHQIHKKHGQNPIDSLRRSWAGLCNAFLVEAKWFASGHVPYTEEYLKNGAVSTGVGVVLIHAFFLLGHCQTEDGVDLMRDNPVIITSTATILRLWDDLGSAKDESQDGYDGSYVACFMKEHKGFSIDSARAQVIHLISDAWKRLNRESLSPNPFSTTFTKAALNLARMIPLMYSYDDNHNLPILEEYMKSMLYDSAKHT